MLNNRRILDVLIRHQIFVEAVKNKKAKDFAIVLQDLEMMLRQIFVNANFDSFEALTKSGLRSLIAEVKAAQAEIFDPFVEGFIDDMLMFMEADIRVSKLIFATLFREKNLDNDVDYLIPLDDREASEVLDDHDEKSIYPISMFNDRRDELWTVILNAPIPANGFLLEDFVENFSNSASNSIENLIRKAYANKLTISAALADIVGTPAKNRRDAALTKIYHQNEAVVATSYQHITSIVQAGLASAFFAKYKWVSVLDNRTTEICISRNGRIYIYGEGPLPPAHHGCRSKTIPFIVGDEFVIPTFYTWIKAQPAAVQDAILGVDTADKLREGSLKSSDLSQFDSNDEMDLDEFESSISDILTR